MHIEGGQQTVKSDKGLAKGAGDGGGNSMEREIKAKIKFLISVIK